MLGPPRLLDVGRVINELESAGVEQKGAVCLARALFLPGDPEAVRIAFQSLDLKGSGTLPMARVRRILPALSRHLKPDDAHNRIAVSLADVSDVQGLEHPDFAQLLSSLSPGQPGDSAKGVLGDALTGLASVEAATASHLSPLQLQRVGRIARRMQQDGYPPQAINVVIRILFISSSRQDLERAFGLLTAIIQAHSKRMSSRICSTSPASIYPNRMRSMNGSRRLMRTRPDV